MPDENNQLYLYEALELRSEYEARIQTLQECLPESNKPRDRFGLSRENQAIRRPSPDFDQSGVREEIKTLEYKRRKLNSAIQETNFKTTIEYHDEEISLNEALELRKSLNDRIGELHNQLVDAAYQRVIYKEGRDIIQESPVSYQAVKTELEQTRVKFRRLNRQLRKVSFETTVPFEDE